MFDCLKLQGSMKFRDFSSLVCICLIRLFFVLSGINIASAQEADQSSIPAVSEETSEEALSSGDTDKETGLEESVPIDGDQIKDSDAALRVIEQVNRELGDGATDFTGGGEALGSPLGVEGERTIVEAFVRMIGGLSIVLFIILIIFYLIRRFGKNVPAFSGARLGQVIGQIHLSRDATLHYVRTGGRVLVIGVNSTGVNLVAEFGASTFDGGLDEVDVTGSFNPDAFIAELKNQTDSYSGGPDTGTPELSSGDDDMAILRSDIHRLQEYLREETRESKD